MKKVTPVGYPQVAFVKALQVGDIQVENGKVTPGFGKGNLARRHCVRMLITYFIFQSAIFSTISYFLILRVTLLITKQLQSLRLKLRGSQRGNLGVTLRLLATHQVEWLFSYKKHNKSERIT